MAQITRSYPGRKADELYRKVDEVMERISREMHLDYRKDGVGMTGSVSRMGIAGVYRVADGRVTIDLTFPMLVPGSLKRRVQESIEQRLDRLFG